MIKNWWFHEDQWYQFWLPQSGALGSLILAAIIISAWFIFK